MGRQGAGARSVRRVGRGNGRGRAAIAVALGAALAVAAVVLACEPDVAATPAITPGTAAAPREVNLIARDYSFLPAVVDLVPGETIVLHLVNGGVVVHEAVFGGAAVQAAWEAAEAAVAGAPPGPTPAVGVPAAVAGLRIVAASGQRVDVTWTVPADGPATPGGFVVGCHIPGHSAEGMVVPVRWVGRDGQPLGSAATPGAWSGLPKAARWYASRPRRVGAGVRPGGVE